MQVLEEDLAAPAAGQVQVRQEAIGFNYIDIYQRQGVYPLPLPTGLGHEAAGVVVAAGPGVSDFKAGDRVAYMNAGVGAYASLRNVPADKLLALPDDISGEDAVAVLFKGMTAQYLLHKTHRVQPGDMVLVHAAAGGVGQILCRWAKHLGAFVVGTAGSAEKCRLAREAGCDIAIDYSLPDWPATLLAETGGRKARVVYDSVGRDTFLHSLDCAAPFGLVVLYGAASGPAPEISPELLNKKGCLFLTRPSVFPHNADPATFRANARVLFDAMSSGAVQAGIGARYRLDDVVQAHEAAQARRTSGAIVLIP
ncbi:quinone oxidoreductase [Pollutimonas sp. H1-120]|uniref:quinone oxidoreductase family protein n=1 Tax=Pollutimonas sp. H1-120 TaxID=3148824 RepID=UPI003B525C84